MERRHRIGACGRAAGFGVPAFQSMNILGRFGRWMGVAAIVVVVMAGFYLFNAFQADPGKAEPEQPPTPTELPTSTPTGDANTAKQVWLLVRSSEGSIVLSPSQPQDQTRARSFASTEQFSETALPPSGLIETLLRTSSSGQFFVLWEPLRGITKKLTVFRATPSQQVSTLIGNVTLAGSSHDDRMFIWGELDGQFGLFSVDLPTGHRALVWTHPRAYEAAVSPDGRRVAYLIANGARQSEIWVASLMPPDGSRRLHSASALLSSPVWSPDSENLAFLQLDSSSPSAPFPLGEVWLVNTVTPNPQRLSQSGARHTDLSWSPDSQYLASVRLSQPTTLLLPVDLSQIRTVPWIIKVADGQTRELRDIPKLNRHPTWSPQGDAIAFLSGSTSGVEAWMATLTDGVDLQRLTTSTPTLLGLLWQ